VDFNEIFVEDVNWIQLAQIWVSSGIFFRTTINIKRFQYWTRNITAAEYQLVIAQKLLTGQTCFFTTGKFYVFCQTWAQCFAAVGSLVTPEGPCVLLALVGVNLRM
jgi:hypothetical protein